MSSDYLLECERNVKAIVCRKKIKNIYKTPLFPSPKKAPFGDGAALALFPERNPR
jgi:hypothetical protein